MTLTGIGKPGVTEDKSILVQDLKIIFLVLILIIGYVCERTFIFLSYGENSLPQIHQYFL